MKDSILNKIKDFKIESPRNVGIAMVTERNLAKRLILKWIEATMEFLMHITG